MLGLFILLVTAALSFAGGYVARASVSRKRRANYLKWEPYVRASRRPLELPAFLIRAPQNEPRRDRPADESSPPTAPQTSQTNTRRGIHAVVSR
jgi:hypothetical protein